MFKRNKNKNNQELGWLPFIKFYTKFKIPWVFLIGTTLFSMAVREIAVLLVPYTSKIMTGAITEGGFLMAFLLLNLASAFAESVQEALIDMTKIRTHRNVNKAIWGRMLRLPMPFYGKDDAQKYVSRVTTDTEGAVGALNCALQIFSIVFGIVEAYRRMYAVYKTIALIILCGIPVIFATSWIVGKLQYKIIYIQNGAISQMTNFFGQRLPGLLHIKTNNMEEEEEKLGRAENDRRYKAEVKAEKMFIFMSPLSSIGNYVFEIVLLIIASALVRSGQMKMFQLVNLYNYYMLFMASALMLIGVWQGFKNSKGTNAITATIMDTEIEDIDSGCAMKDENENITFEHVSFSYDGKTPVLQDVSFTIPKGKKTVLIGENGSGKSTIIKLLERFEEPACGTIRIGDKKLSELQIKDLRDKVGYLSQGNQIVAGSIRENITYGIDRPCSDEEVKLAAEKAYALDFISEKKEGFDTVISRFDNKVSGGEMQRIAVARMLLKQPLYLVMDEATSGIDAVSQRAVMESIDEMMKDKTVVTISHNIDEIRMADHIVALNQGKIEAAGSYEYVYENSEMMREFAKNAEHAVEM